MGDDDSSPDPLPQRAALLAGLLLCGRCGRTMQLDERSGRYTCARPPTYDAPQCVHVDGASLNAAMIGACFATLAPAQLDLLAEVAAEQQADHRRLARRYLEGRTPAGHVISLPQRHESVEVPESWTGTAEVERRSRWALRAVIEGRAISPQLSPAMLDQLRQIGRRLPTLWRNERLTPAQLSELLRSLIWRVVVTRAVADTIEVKVLWVSGAITPLTVRSPR